MPATNQPPQDSREWIRSDHAAQRVGYTHKRFLQAAKRNQITAHYPGGNRHAWFLHTEIQQWAKFRQFRTDYRHRHAPCGPGRLAEQIDPEIAKTFLITAIEAAKRLGVSVKTIRTMVAAGRLATYQNHPRTKGSKLWISPTAIKALLENIQYQQRRQAYHENKHKAHHREIGDPDNRPHRNGRWAEIVLKKYGRNRELITAAEAAKRLGVSTTHIDTLRRKGRLLGEKLHRNTKPLRYWYYHPADIEKLLQDEQRLKYRQAQRPHP